MFGLERHAGSRRTHLAKLELSCEDDRNDQVSPRIIVNFAHGNDRAGHDYRLRVARRNEKIGRGSDVCWGVTTPA